MPIRLRAALAAPLLALAGPAAAQPVSGLYVGLGIGSNWREEATPLRARNPAIRGVVFTDPGPGLVGALGWGFGNGLRLEVEGSWRRNEVSGFGRRRDVPDRFSTSVIQGWGGRTETAALMANAVYDFDLRRWRLPVQPYLGVGIGAGWRDYANAGGSSLEGVIANGTPIPIRIQDERRNGTRAVFAWQLIAGVALPIARVPGLSVTAEYRHFGMARVKYDVTYTETSATRVGAPPFVARGTEFDDNRHHAALIGLRYALGVPRLGVTP